jgi:hypothetical protein
VKFKVDKDDALRDDVRADTDALDYALREVNRAMDHLMQSSSALRDREVGQQIQALKGQLRNVQYDLGHLKAIV